MVKLSSLLQATPLLATAVLTDAKHNVRGRKLELKSLKSERLFYPYKAAGGCFGNGADIQQILRDNGQTELSNMFMYTDLDKCCHVHFAGLDACVEVGLNQAEHMNEMNVVTEALSRLKPSRRLHKSYAKQYAPHGKSGKGAKSSKSGKGGKGSKSGSDSLTGWHHGHHHKHKKTPKPSSKDVGFMPDPDAVTVTMGGLLTAHKIQAPTSGSDMLAMAESFEKTILRVLEPGFAADIHSICGVPITANRKLGEVGSGPVCEVEFDLMTYRPCRGCDDMGMLIMGAQVFEDTFGVLNGAAESGELQQIYCIYAFSHGVVSDSCVTEISSVEGTSLDVSRGEGLPTTPRPSLPPVAPVPVTPAPIDMQWMPTPPPVEASSFPSPSGDVTLPPIATPPPQAVVVPTPPPMGDATPTMPPMEGSAAPTYYPSYIPSANPVSGGITMPPAPVLPMTEPPSSQGGKPGTTTAPSPGSSMESTPSISEPATVAPVEASSFPSPSGDVTLPPIVSGPPQTESLPTPSPVGGALPTMPPGITASPTYSPSYVPTANPIIGGESTPPVFSTPAPVEGQVPTMPPGMTLPPAMSSLVPTVSSNETASLVPTIGNATSSLAPSAINMTSIAPSIASNATSFAPTVANVSTSFVPTVASNETDGPPGALYFEGFEDGLFPVAPWSTEGDEPWAIDTERVRSGTYSIKSGDLDLLDTTQKNSNVTFVTNADWPDGTLVLSVLAGVQLPIDDFLYFVDGEFRGQVSGKNNWELLKIPLPPGEHTVMFSYKSNPLGLPELPPSSPTHIGAVYIDNVYYLPAGFTVAPTMAGTSTPPVITSLAPVATSSVPTVANVNVTGSPSAAENGTSSMVPTPAPSVMNVTQSFMPSISSNVTTSSPTLTNVSSSMVPTISNITSSMVPTIANVSSSMLPTISSNETASLVPTISNVTSSMVPTVGNDTSSMVPTVGNVTSSMVPTIGNATASLVPTISSNETASMVPTISNGTTSIVPTIGNATTSLVPTISLNETGSSVPTVAGGGGGDGPAGSLYFEGFEDGQFPVAPWFTEGDAPWEIDTERVRSGAYSIRSGALDVTDLNTKYSNLTFITNPDWPDGSLILSVLAGTELPLDELSYFVDQQFRGKVTQNNEWQQLRIPLPPGQHTILFSYITNPFGLLEFPPASPTHLEAVHFDNVYFIPSGVTAAPTEESSALPPAASTLPPASGGVSPSPSVIGGPGSMVPTVVNGTTSMVPTIGNITTSMVPTISSIGTGSSVPTIVGGGSGSSNEPTYYPSYLPSKNPSSDVGSSSSPTVAIISGSPIAGEGGESATAIIFDGFETGDLAALDWSISGVEGWTVDDTKPYEGSFSAHVKTADIPNGGDYSQLDLAVSLEEPGFIQFYFNAPVAMPFESFELYVDGSFLTPLATPDGNWTQAGAILSSGDHTVSWRYANNPGGVPDDVISTVPQPPYRTGEAWLDNVALLPATESFVEDLESQDFSTNNWILSGDAEWTITDTNAQDGTYSATVTSADIPESTGSARLSIDIITEQGGTLSYWILPSVAGPFDVAHVLVDGVIVFTYSNVESDWVTQDIQIQPGKREVTFELQKNPGAIPDDAIATIPKPDGHLGQVWLDTISFTTN